MPNASDRTAMPVNSLLPAMPRSAYLMSCVSGSQKCNVLIWLDSPLSRSIFRRRRSVVVLLLPSIVTSSQSPERRLVGRPIWLQPHFRRLCSALEKPARRQAAAKIGRPTKTNSVLMIWLDTGPLRRCTGFLIQLARKRSFTVSDPKTRRFFLGALTAASAVRVWGANDKVNVGIVGLGGRGSSHLNTYTGLKEAQVVALCDVNQAAREKAQGTLARKSLE